MWKNRSFKSMKKWRLLCLFIVFIPTLSFRITWSGEARKQLRCFPLHESSSDFDYGEDDDWLTDADDSSSPMLNTPQRKDKSRIPEFVEAFMKEKSGEEWSENFQFTHLLAVPMTENHELQIELESVQRAVIYHCPKLVHACITSGLSRMPLLLVDASREPLFKVNAELQGIVQRVVHKHCFAKEEGYFAGDPSYAGVNKNGNRPLTMKFHKLEIDGAGHEALFTVADDDMNGGLKKLRFIVSDLEEEIKARGWKTMWPPSDVQGTEEQEQEQQTGEFLPRIPLMRLPPDFEDYLDPLDDENDIRLSEDGGNGISPLFWIKWEKDVMARDVRLHGIGVYHTVAGLNDMREQAFYAAQDPVRLPEGNEALAGQEKIHKEYQDKRMEKMERRVLDDDEFGNDDDIVDPTLTENRKIIESIYEQDSSLSDDGFLPNQADGEGDMQTDNALADNASLLIERDKKTETTQGANAPLEGWMQDRINEISRSGKNSKNKTQPSLQSINTEEASSSLSGSKAQEQLKRDNTSDDWMENRVRDIIENQSSAKQMRNFAKTNADLPPLDENPIIQELRNRNIFGNETLSKENVEQDISTKPYNSQEDLCGFWKIMRSPLKSSLENDGEYQCDNFILRSDGNIGGGPILVKATQQKAGGGTWKKLNIHNKTVLQLRLVIPPERERVMVWEGEIREGLESSSGYSAQSIDSESFQETETGSSHSKAKKIVKCVGQVGCVIY
mmetsp:Transcript_14925/g.22783  ORF Transcript_14925/g.22783 Transcript_14925/m.22783 type:complete len:729 (+) Transcript_14925:43-2229(+)